MLTERQEHVLRRLVEVYLDDGAPVGLQGAEYDVRVGAVDDPPRAGESRGAGSAGASAHVRRAGADRGRLPLLRRPAAARAVEHGSRHVAVAVARPPRARRGDAGHDRDALAGHQPARDRHRAADRDVDDPPRRAAGAAAAGADDRRDHIDRRRLQTAVHLSPADRHRSDRLGRELPQRADGRARTRRADAAPAPVRPEAARDRAGVPGVAGAGVHRARGFARGDARTSTVPRSC